MRLDSLLRSMALCLGLGHSTHAALAAEESDSSWVRTFSATCQTLHTPSQDFSASCADKPTQVSFNFVTPLQNAFLTLDFSLPGLPSLRMRVRDGRTFKPQGLVRLHVTAINGQDIHGSCSLQKGPGSSLNLGCLIGDDKASAYIVRARAQPSSTDEAQSIFEAYALAADKLSGGAPPPQKPARP